MSLFNIFKKKNTLEENKQIIENDPLENFPELLSAKLLFIEKPNLDGNQLLAGVKKHFAKVEHSFSENTFIFSFPDHTIQLADAIIPAQCTMMIPNQGRSEVELPEAAFQQNWHWPEANQIAKNCTYEILVTDFMSRTLPYKERLNLFMDFLVEVIKVTEPNAVYSSPAQKILNPGNIISIWDTDKIQTLNAICNVRLYNISNSPNHKELLMDTLGLHTIGLPDFQIRFSAADENEMANLLWTYAYYAYEYGDVILEGNTLEGLKAGSKWKCEKQLSLVAPERIVVNVTPD
ncbi:DUF4261 domain-containing protein [Pedobacter sp. KBS0701]|uniref:DUF4261 domain-containing protein n=1 Tax=Pedobacter sp. KBS0701 TaxID=2578106 RepID=UPI00110F1F75|nr:DUF4261 domain-containing protein [Pedobacter sp. KBS0701]QDW27861.1 DUF4261 domain-containing protein [Pedobacter sp. KBS0701]